jgi:hypothetical protein
MTFTAFSGTHSLFSSNYNQLNALCNIIVVCGERISSIITFKTVAQI